MFRRHRDRPTEGKQAREKAERELRRVRAETPWYQDLGERLRDLREENHFGENVAAALRGRKS